MSLCAAAVAAYRPEGDINTLYGFTAGQQGEVVVNFTANPQPTKMTWTVGSSIKVPAGGESLDRRFMSGNLEPVRSFAGGALERRAKGGGIGMSPAPGKDWTGFGSGEGLGRVFSTGLFIREKRGVFN